MVLKNVLARERPYNTEGALLTVEKSADRRAVGEDFSFPSGHAISSFFPPQRLFCCTAKN